MFNSPLLKFMFSEKATKIDKIFTVNLIVLVTIKLTVKMSSIFVAFLENTNFICLVILRVDRGTKTTIVFYANIVYDQKFTRNAKHNFEYLKIIRTYLFSLLLHFQPLKIWSMIGPRVKISHYIQPIYL